MNAPQKYKMLPKLFNEIRIFLREFLTLLFYSILLMLPYFVTGIDASEAAIFAIMSMFFFYLPHFPRSPFVLVQAAQMLNVLTLGHPIYSDQVRGLFSNPVEALQMGGAEIQYLAVCGTFLYVIILAMAFPVGKRDSHGVLQFTVGIILGLSTCLLVLSNAPNSAQHPVLLLKDAIAGKDSLSKITISEGLQPLRINDVKPKKVILVIGESQDSYESSGIDETRAPNTFRWEREGSLTRFTNLSQLGAFTSLAYQQILNGVPFGMLEQPHYKLTDIPSYLSINAAFISSRNLQWGRMAAQYSTKFKDVLDCTAIDPNCGLIDGVDDMRTLELLVKPRIKNSYPLIIWQLNGSHNPLANKFPDSFATGDDYRDSIAYNDHVMDQLLSLVDDDTWVVYMADHGHQHNAANPFVHAFIFHKNDGGLRSKINKDRPLTQIDLLKTTYELLGVQFNEVEAYNVITETAPIERDRVTYRFYNENSKQSVPSTQNAGS